MSLKIEDGETERLVAELARLTGESPEGAVRRAVAERLDRLRGRAGVSARIMEIAKDSTSRFPADMPDHWEMLYGGDGLPR